MGADFVGLSEQALDPRPQCGERLLVLHLRSTDAVLADARPPELLARQANETDESLDHIRSAHQHSACGTRTVALGVSRLEINGDEARCHGS